MSNKCFTRKVIGKLGLENEVYLLIHSKKYLLIAFCAPDTSLGARDSVVSKQK